MASLQVALPSGDRMSLRCKEESTDGALSHSRTGARAVPQQGARCDDPGTRTNTYLGGGTLQYSCVCVTRTAVSDKCLFITNVLGTFFRMSEAPSLTHSRSLLTHKVSFDRY